MVANFTIIIIQCLHPSTLSHIQILLVEQVLKAFMIRIDHTLGTIQVMPPKLQCKYNCTQLKIVGGVILFVHL
ncbi:hypothetical protein Hanom_Chr12g01118581 [Helianthus anomalus]